jgi:hypothetical protein
VTVPPAGSAPRSAVIDGIDVDAVAAAARACPGVSGLDGGPFSGVASYLPGRKIEGIVVRDGRVTVQVRSRWAVPAPELAAVITAMLAPLTGNRPVDVVIADIDDPPAAPAPSAPAGVARPALTPGCRRLEQPETPGFSQHGCE